MKEDKPSKKKPTAPVGGADAKTNKAAKERAKSRSKSVGDDGQGETRELEHSKAEHLAVARLQTYYQDKIAPELMKRFAFSSPMQVPRITKISLNMGVGEAVGDKKVLDAAVADMTKIAGQKPVTTKAKKAIATYKTRKGYPIGCMVTLRRRRMYEFLDRLVSIAIPRTRDFRGISGKGFDGRGNYSMGIKEQIIFPEIDYDKVDTLRGMNISITTTAKTDEEARALLDGFNFPFKK